MFFVCGSPNAARIGTGFANSGNWTIGKLMIEPGSAKSLCGVRFLALARVHHLADSQKVGALSDSDSRRDLVQFSVNRAMNTDIIQISLSRSISPSLDYPIAFFP
jgi:hypothetical protein